MQGLAPSISSATPGAEISSADGISNSKASFQAAPLSASKLFIWWTVLVTLASFLVKVWWIPQIPGSALFADDYNTLNRVLLFATGIIHPTSEQYIFDIIPSGLVYQAVLTPISLFGIPGRLYAAFAINAILCAIFVITASFAAAKISGSRSLLIPLAFATMGAPFIFSFYVMTENGVFALLGVLFLFVAHLDYVLRNWLAFVGMAVTAALLALTRTPGLAVTPALLLTIWNHREQLGVRGLFARIGILTATVGGSYAWYLHIVSGAREAKYTHGLTEALTKIDVVPVLLKLVTSQLGYIFFASAFWVLPVILLFPFSKQFKTKSAAWDAFVFGVVSGALFVGFCLAHLILKMYQTNGEGWFIFGRYDDPALIVLSILGVSLLPLFQERGWLQKAFFVLFTGILLATSAYYLGQQKWMPINFAGLGIFASNSKGVLPASANWIFAGFLILLALPRRVRTEALLGAMIVFGYYTIYHGMAYTKHRAQGIGYSLEGSFWLVRNTPETAHICLDWTVANDDAPGAIKRVGNVYRALAFQIYPRPYSILRYQENPSRCNYIYSLLSSAEKLPATVVWQNADYAVLQPTS